MEGVAKSPAPAIDESVAVMLADILVDSDEEMNSVQGQLFKEESVEKMMRELYEEIMGARSGSKMTSPDEPVELTVFEGELVKDSPVNDMKDDEGLVQEENGQENDVEPDGTE